MTIIPLEVSHKQNNVTALGPRKLTDHEKFFQIGQVTVLYSVSGKGIIDPSALHAALIALTAEYPVLHGSVESYPGDIELLPEFNLIFLTGPSLPQPLFQYYAQVFQPGHYPILETLISLQRLIALELYQSSSEEYTIVMYIRHIISDAKNGIALLHRLWELYTEKLNTGSISLRTSAVIPRNNEDVLTEIQRTEFPPFNLEYILNCQSIHTAPEITGNPELLNPPVRLHLTEELSTTLKNTGKTYGLTINSLISAALILAEFELLAREGRLIPEFLLNTEVDLRPHVSPQVGELDITNFLGNSFYAVPGNRADLSSPITRREAFLYYAQEVKQKILQDLRDGQVYSYTRFTPEALQLAILMLTELKTPLSHTNWGIIKEFAAPAEIQHTDFRGWNIIAPDTSLEDPVGLLAILFYNAIIFTSTYHNRISVDIVQSGPFFPLDSAEFIAQSMQTILQDWIDHA